MGSRNKRYQAHAVIADSEEIISGLLAQRLEQIGCKVKIEVANTNDLFSVLQTSYVDLLLTELTLQKCGDVLELLEWITLERKVAATIVLTREKDKKILQQAANNQVQVVLQKQKSKINDLIKIIQDVMINPSETITIPIGEAYRVLELYTDEIATVSEWARYMGYSNILFTIKCLYLNSSTQSC